MEDIKNQIYQKFLNQAKKPYENLQEMSKNPMKYNEELLMKIIHDNEDTSIGIKYNFKNIHSIKEYQENVPISNYDDYIDFLLPMVYKGIDDLITVYPVKHYNKSSGTLGNPKKIPISEVAQKSNFIYSLPFCFYLFDRELGDSWRKGKIFLIAQFSVDTLPSGASYGALTAKIAGNMKDYFNSLSTSPTEILFPKEDSDSRYLHSLYALMDKDITVVICAYFSYFLEILRFIEGNWKMLVNDIRLGKINEGINISENLRNVLESQLEPMPERADELEHIFTTGIGPDFIHKVWPNMQVFEGIGTSTFSNYVDKIREKYSGDSIPFLFLGLQASEGMISTPLKLNSPDSAFLPDAMFFEFRPVEQEGYDNLLTLKDLELGHDYEIVLTNLSGFYRYTIKDVIRVTGFYNKLPLMTFMYRVNQMVNLTGEKTTEIALRDSIIKTESDLGLDCVDFSVYADTDAVPMNYDFLIEASNLDPNLSLDKIRERIEYHLSKSNPSYGAKVVDGTFGPTGLKILQSETFMLYRDLMAMKCVSVVQLKPPRVIVNEVQRRFFYTLIDPRF